MNKLTTALIGAALLLSALFTGSSAFASDNTCVQLGRVEIPVTDPAYNADMDKDKDGIACEVYRGKDGPAGNSPGATSNGTTQDGSGAVAGPNGDTQGTGTAPGTTNPSDLASTGWSALWAGIGVLALLVGLVTVFISKRKTA